jgi:hypothetical protein
MAVELVNQAGEPVSERHIYLPEATPRELAEILGLLLERMNMHAVETNATKHGRTEIELRGDTD